MALSVNQTALFRAVLISSTKLAYLHLIANFQENEMAIRVGINGFGRIGRMLLRATLNEPLFADVQVVAINGLEEPDYMLYMLQCMGG